MSRIVTAIEIRVPVERVLEYSSSPGNWPSLHAASNGGSGAIDHSAAPGERITEDNHASGRSWRAIWTVRACEFPHRRVIEGEVDGGGSATITYRLTSRNGGTRFERELLYRMPSLKLILERAPREATAQPP
jgi:hypothetical protein